MKVVKFNTTQGQFYIPLLKIAENRASHYVPSKEKTSYQEEIDFVMNDDFEGIDWLINNTDFDEWDNDAIKLNSEVNVLEDDFWCSSDDFDIIEIFPKEKTDKISNVLLGELITGDFQESTLTFEIDGNFKVKAGHYALVEIDDYKKLKRALTSCKMSLQAHPDNTTYSEFEGFVSLADEILNRVES